MVLYSSPVPPYSILFLQKPEAHIQNNRELSHLYPTPFSQPATGFISRSKRGPGLSSAPAPHIITLTDRVNHEGLPLNQPPFSVLLQKVKNAGSWPWNQGCSVVKAGVSSIIKRWGDICPGSEWPSNCVNLPQTPLLLPFCLFLNLVTLFLTWCPPAGVGWQCTGQPLWPVHSEVTYPHSDTHRAGVFSISLRSLILPSGCHVVFGKWLHFCSYFLSPKCILTQN